MIHHILHWKETIDDKNAEKSASAAKVKSIYLPSVNASEDESETDLSTEKSSKSKGQQSNKNGGDLTNKASSSTEKASSAQNDNTDDERENPTEDDDNSVDSGNEDEKTLSAGGDEEGAIQSTGLNTKQVDNYGKQPLLGLVLTPTRELAVQVKHHIDAVAQFTGL